MLWLIQISVLLQIAVVRVTSICIKAIKCIKGSHKKALLLFFAKSAFFKGKLSFSHFSWLLTFFSQNWPLTLFSPNWPFLENLTCSQYLTLFCQIGHFKEKCPFDVLIFFFTISSLFLPFSGNLTLERFFTTFSSNWPYFANLTFSRFFYTFLAKVAIFQKFDFFTIFK